MTLTRPSVGDLTDPAVMDEYADAIEALQGGLPMLSAWSSYTPVWTSSGTAVSLGNGTVSGAYFQVGKLCHFRALITMGSTTTFGTGVYRVSLPVTPAAVDLIFHALCFDSSASLRWGGTVCITTAAATGDNMRIAATDGVAHVGTTQPFTWAQSDKLIIGGSYNTA